MTSTSRTTEARSDFKAAAKDGIARDSRPPPISIRVNEAERPLLLERARGDALGPYINRYVLDRHRIAAKARRKPLSKHQQAIAHSLRSLGLSGISGILDTLLLAVEEGRLPIEHHGKAGRMRPKMNPRTLLQTGGDSGPRSSSLYFQKDSKTEETLDPGQLQRSFMPAPPIVRHG